MKRKLGKIQNCWFGSKKLKGLKKKTKGREESNLKEKKEKRRKQERKNDRKKER